MNYIGSKHSLLGFIEDSIGQVTDNKFEVFCDLFAGTGAVGIRFKKNGFKVISNDLQYYSYALNRHYIGNHNEMNFDELVTELRPADRLKHKDKVEYVFDYLNSLKGKKGFIYNNFCLGGTKGKEYERQYFSDENGMKCDAIRQKIEEWKQKKKISEDEYFFLIASLIEAIDKVANTASVYGAFLKQLKKSAQKTLILKPAPYYINHKNHSVFNENINDLLDKVDGDVLYLDPPYNHRQYATNYHLLETIARYDNPKLFGKTGLRDYARERSLYNSRIHVKDEFTDLIKKAKAKYIFLSYNNEGLMTPDEVKEIMSKRGKYGVFKKKYNRFKADNAKNRSYRADSTTEYLHYVVCD